MHPTKYLQRLVLTSFIVTFALARVIVFFIMSRDIPDLYFHFAGTHVHHLNYGIFILSLVGAVMLFKPPAGKWLGITAVAYGIGLALTFDEFGMWLHLVGGYWQRASFDAITIIGGILLLLAYTPPIKYLATYWTRRRFVLAIFLLAILSLFFWRLAMTLTPIEQEALPKLERLEKQGPN